MIGVEADPLSLSRRFQMGVLFVILLVTLGLAFRAVTAGRRVRVAGSDGVHDTALMDAYTRTSLLVLVCLLGLFALGLAYGNVLGGGP